MRIRNLADFGPKEDFDVAFEHSFEELRVILA